MQISLVIQLFLTIFLIVILVDKDGKLSVDDVTEMLRGYNIPESVLSTLAGMYICF